MADAPPTMPPVATGATVLPSGNVRVPKATHHRKAEPLRPEEQTLTVRGHVRTTRRVGKRTKIKDKTFCRMCLSLALEGFSIRTIAKRLHTATDTVSYVLNAMNVEERRKEAAAHIAEELPAIASMVAADTLAKRDRRLGHEILSQSGVYEGAKAKQGEEGGRIVIEWAGAMPPWAPRDPNAPTQPEPAATDPAQNAICVWPSPPLEDEP